MSQVIICYFSGMFVRKKKNDSGKICVQVIDKSNGKYKVLHTVGSSYNEDDISSFVKEARSWIKQYSGTIELDFSNEDQLIHNVLENIRKHELIGLDLLLGRIFDEIGFDKIDDPLFKQLVIYRLAYPKSKLKTTQYLRRYQQIDWSEDQVYRYLDKLYHGQKEHVQQISFNHTKKIFGNEISVVFYDVTTLYFEIDKEDDLRKTGFSKEGKHQNPQIVLGLLVSKEGYPLAYEIFEGNKFEGHTMLPVIDAFKKKFDLDQLVIVADSGLLSNQNIEELVSKGYEFILGARIKNEKKHVQDKILSLKLKNGQSQVVEKMGLKLIITHSDSRAKKDRANREKGLGRLEKHLSKGKLTKASINNRGYNKYLRLDGEIKVTIDYTKFDLDSKWDGLKGYLTNAKMSKNEIIENYQHLWQIEKAFRISKTDLKIRPIYHRLKKRIEAHICIAFASYKVYKELERQLKIRKAEISAETAIEIAKTIFQLELESPKSKSRIKKLLIIDEEQRYLADLFNF